MYAKYIRNSTGFGQNFHDWIESSSTLGRTVMWEDNKLVCFYISVVIPEMPIAPLNYKKKSGSPHLTVLKVLLTMGYRRGYM